MATLTTRQQSIRPSFSKGKVPPPRRPGFWTILMHCLAGIAA